MGDNKRWYKVWTSILSDPDFLSLDNESKGIWVILGALVAKHGVKGKISVKENYFYSLIQMQKEACKGNVKALESVNLFIEESDDSTIEIKFKKWHLFQIDSTGYLRQQKYRKKHQSDISSNVTVTQENKSKKKIKIKNGFETFYEIYPNKKAPKKARESWEKINPDQQLYEKILSSLEIQKNSSEWCKDNGNFIPHPTTWLNQQRWEDEIKDGNDGWD